MKQYMKLVRDGRNGEVKHIVTSERPIDDAMVPEDPSIPKSELQIESYEFDSTRFVRARELLDNVDFVRQGNNVNINAKQGKSINAGNFRPKK